MSTVQLANFASGTGVFDATMYNGAGLDSSPAVGNADLLLKSASSQYVKMSTTFTSQAAGVGNGMSVAGWFFPVGAQSVGSTIFDVSGTTTALSLFYGTTNTLTGYYNGVDVSSTYAITPDAWHFFCYTTFCTPTNGVVQSLYVDNPSTNVAIQSTGSYTQFSSNTSYLGWGYGNANGLPYNYFNGKLDDFRLYNRSLAPPEIGVLYNYNYTTNTITPTSTGAVNTATKYINTVRLDVSGTFSGVTISRTPAFSGGSVQVSSANLTSYDGINWSYYDSGVLQGNTYTYSLTPYVGSTNGTIVSIGSIATTALLNGFFNTLTSGSLPSANTALPTANIASWTISSGTNPYYLCAGTGNGLYTSTLPSLITYYVDLYTAAGTSSNISQIVTTPNYYISGVGTSSSNFSGTVTFYAWPVDASYNTGCSLTVSLGGVKLLNGFTFAAGTAVPYTSFSLPFTVPSSTANLLTFTVANSSTTASSICLAGVQINSQLTTAVRFSSIDPISQQLYYPMDVSYGSPGKIYNYASGVGTGTAAQFYGNATLLNTAITPIIGSGYLSTDGTAGTYFTMDPWTCPTNSASSGFSIAGWFYPLSITGNPTLCYLSNGSGSVSISLNASGAVDFSFNNTNGNFIINNFTAQKNRWYFIAMTAAGSAGSTGTYNFYVNDISLGYSNTLNWPNTGSSYTSNYLGGLPASPVVAGANGTLNNFNGYIDEFRLYNRTL